MGNEAEFFATDGAPFAVEAAFEHEPYDGHATVAADVEAARPVGEVETSLADEDEAALEAGIASVFDSILAGTGDEYTGAADGLDEDGDDAFDVLPAEFGEDGTLEPTLALLAELNRIWAQPLAA